MTDDFNTALTLLAIGMITVFMVLLFVVLAGNLLIKFVNKFVPASIEPVVERAASNAIAPSKSAAIKMAIDQLSGGKAEVKNIEKI